LLIMLASFIIASISYIANIIPETTLGSNISGSYLPAVYVGRYNWSTRGYNPTRGYSDTVFSNINLPSPQQNRSYLIVAPLPPNALNATVIQIIINNVNVTDIARNNTHIFAKWSLSIPWVEIRIYNVMNAHIDYINIYSVDSRIQLPPPSSYLNNETGVSMSISNKLIINFIGWVAGIVIMLEALRRFDLEI
jgi:hypothetical protein